MADLIWQNPPEQKIRKRGNPLITDEILEQLSENPGKWALLKKNSYLNTYRRLEKKFPQLEFSYVSVTSKTKYGKPKHNVDIYVRSAPVELEESEE